MFIAERGVGFCGGLRYLHAAHCMVYLLFVVRILIVVQESARDSDARLRFICSFMRSLHKFSCSSLFFCISTVVQHLLAFPHSVAFCVSVLRLKQLSVTMVFRKLKFSNMLSVN